ncbi:MAG: ATP-binding protein [Methanomassiliicoccus sp.]|nr:ATP-binding protein [Methanomassiliicoccus sp.]
MQGQDPELGTKRAVSMVLLAASAVAAVIAAMMNNLIVFVLSCLSGYLLMLPSMISRRVRWEYPNIYNSLLLILAYFSLVSGSIFIALGIGSLWTVISQLAAGAMVGTIGFLISYAMLRSEIEAGHITPVPVAVFSFVTGLALGALWEIVEFGLDVVLSWRLQTGLDQTMADLAAAALGAGTVALTSLAYMRNPRPSLFHRLLESASDKAPGLMTKRDNASLLRTLIARGEGERLEFKSSLRTNLRTGEADKRMEHAVLKTIAAFLNSDGGTLLVGVKDDGSILGVDVQNFDNLDKFYLHFTNLVGEGLGKETFPFVDSRMIGIDGRAVLEVRCIRAHSPAFLTNGTKEEFFVRSGASSVELLGREMLEYVGNHFDR